MNDSKRRHGGDLTDQELRAIHCVAAMRVACGPLIACPVVRLKERLGLELEEARRLARRLELLGVWTLRRTGSGLMYAAPADAII